MSEEIICCVLGIFESLANVTSNFILGDSVIAIILSLFFHGKEILRISALKIVIAMMENAEFVTLMIESNDFDFVSKIQKIYLHSGSNYVKKTNIFERIY